MDQRTVTKITSVAASVLASGVIIWFTLHFWKKIKKNQLIDKYRFTKRSVEELKHVQWEDVGEVSKLFVYPIKSCAGISLPGATAEKHGFMSGEVRDRSLVIMDKNGNFVSGKRESQSVLIHVSIDENSDGLVLRYRHLQPLKLDLSLIAAIGDNAMCSIYGEYVPGIDCGDDASDWLKLIFNDKPYRLLYFGNNLSSRAIANEEYPMISNNDAGLYSNMSGFMLMTESSVEDLHQRVDDTISVENFRPNILLKGTVPYDEDNWHYIKIGGAIFRNIKPCDRCPFITIDHATGERDLNMEPLKTLRKYRCHEGNKSPFFGINLGLDLKGTMNIGDKVYVLRN